MLADIPLMAEVLIIIILGLALGSFATALIHRIPRGISWIVPTKDKSGVRSACPSCGHVLGVLDLIPLFSWAFTKGRCRYCKAAISKRYPVTELIVLCLCLVTYAVYGFSINTAIIILMLPFLTGLLMIDLEHMILPNQLVLIIAILGVVFAALNVFQGSLTAQTFLLMHVFGGLIYTAFAWGLGAIMSKLLKKEALGFGDVKFFGCAGIWLGLPLFAAFCACAGIFGATMGISWQKIKKQENFPFGPALIASFYVLLMLQGSHFV